METFNPEINSSSIIDILTLRYDSSIIPNLPKKTWIDFKPNNTVPNIDVIEDLILNDISKKLELLNPKKLCIALSGGVDSTLILSLIRKSNPDIDIEAISIKFANSVDETLNASKIADKSSCPVIISGGVSSINDIRKAKCLNKNIEGIIVGKAIYDGDIKLEELVKELNA